MFTERVIERLRDGMEVRLSATGQDWEGHGRFYAALCQSEDSIGFKWVGFGNTLSEAAEDLDKQIGMSWQGGAIACV